MFGSRPSAPQTLEVGRLRIFCQNRQKQLFDVTSRIFWPGFFMFSMSMFNDGFHVFHDMAMFFQKIDFLLDVEV